MPLRKMERRLKHMKVELERRSHTRRHAMEPTEIEKENLEAHVELCYARHESVTTRLDKIEEVMEDLEVQIHEKSTLIYSTLLKVGGSIIATLVGVIITIYLK